MTRTGKKQSKTSRGRTFWAFLAGIALPLCLAFGWHQAYGQEGQASPDRQPRPLSAPPAHPLPAKSSSPSQLATAKKSPPSQASPAQGRDAASAQSPDAASAQARTGVSGGSLLASSAPAASNGAASHPSERLSPQDEATRLREVFQAQVVKATRERFERVKKLWAKNPKVLAILEERQQRLERLDRTFYDFVRRDVTERMAASALSFDTPQYFVWADRNPVAQFLVVGLIDPRSGRIDFLGADLISSGNIEKGGDYFVTPLGVFENLVENFSYRAQGTPNAEGWRGLGAKDARVWDFGDQKSLKKYKTGETISQMRLLMHSTDPDRGEQRLGRTDSKGCIRISQGLNRFLDAHAILDFHYEEWAKTKPDSWLLRKDRTPVSYPGRYLIIGDSSLSSMQAQARP